MRKLGRSTARTGHSKGYSIPQSITLNIETGGSQLRGTIATQRWAGHGSAAGEQPYCASLVPCGFYSPLSLFSITIISNSLLNFVLINELLLFECTRLTFPIPCPSGLGGEWLGLKHNDSLFPCAEKLSHLETTGVLAFYMEKGEGTWNHVNY